jgi:hypothetical protein
VLSDALTYRAISKLKQCVNYYFKELKELLSVIAKYSLADWLCNVYEIGLNNEQYILTVASGHMQSYISD